MQLKDRVIVGVIIIVSLFGFKIYQNSSRNDLTNTDIESIITTAEQSFIKAETAVFKNVPVDPDDTPIGPHPDPDKCICKGTGKIVQGDGHVSDCPYHKKPEPIESKTKCKCDTRNTYCNCIPAYGKCSCQKISTSNLNAIFPPTKSRGNFPLLRGL